MSEETTPAKKAARKSVRKKSASKRSPRKNEKSESEESDGQLPLEGSSGAAEVESAQASDSSEQPENAARQGREPKSGVRDARRETSGEPTSTEVTEKLVPDDGGEKAPQENSRNHNRREGNESSDESQRDQGKQQDPNDRRSRGRGRGGRDRDRDRPEKREIKPRLSVDSKSLSKKAWKIFESEVTEEGLALLDDNGLRDYARSSFNAARIFLEEKERVVGREKKDKGDSDKD